MSRATRAIIQLFPGYLFVLAAERWRSIASVNGVQRVLLVGDQPAQVSDEVIAQLRSREGADGLLRLSHSKFSLGQPIHILRGVFADQLAIYDGQSGRERAFVLLQWLGSQRRVIVDQDNLSAA